ncbi:hypothetical protein MTO96_035733 [Rhipicephalus appendiculatus]
MSPAEESELQESAEPDGEPPADGQREAAVTAPEDGACQTDLTAADIAAMEEDLVSQNKAVYDLRVTVNRSRFTEEVLGEDNDKVCFYTGLPSFAVLMAVFHMIEHRVSHSINNVLSKFEEMMLFLMRL